MSGQQRATGLPEITSNPPQQYFQQSFALCKWIRFLKGGNNVGKKWRVSFFTAVLVFIGLFSLVYSTKALADLIFYPDPIENFQTRVVLYPQFSSEIDATDLSEVRKVVSKRLDQLDVPGSYQLIAENNHLNLTMLATEQTPYVIDLVSHTGQIQFIDGGKNSPPLGQRIQTGTGVALPGVYPVLFDAQDVEAVRPSDTEAGHIFYRLGLSISGAQRMADFVASRPGNYVCMVIDQQVINCSSMYHLTDDNLDILPSLTSGSSISLNDLAVFVESGPLPIPLTVER